MVQCDPNCCLAIGANAKLAVSFIAAPDDDENGDPVGRTFSSSSVRQDFLYETVAKQRRRVGNRTIKGSLDDYSARSVEGATLISGRISLQGSARVFETFLPAILGKVNTDKNGEAISDPGGSLFHPNCRQNFDMMVMLDDQAVLQFVQLYVNKTTIRARNIMSADEPEIVEVFMDVIGKAVETDNAWPDPEPTFVGDTADQPYTIGDCTLTLADTALEMDAFTLEINSELSVKWRTRKTPTCIFPTRNEVKLRAEVPLCAEVFDVIHETAGGENHITGSLAIALTDVSTTFTFGKLDNVGPDPVVQGKDEVMHMLDLYAYADETDETPSIIVVNDATSA